MSVLHRLARFVLAWFVLSVGAAIASPMVQPQSVQLVCAAAGSVKIVVQSDDGARELGASHLDCPMCAPTGAPPPLAQPVGFLTAPPPDHPARSTPPARIGAATAAPLPPRGPPALS